MEQLETAYRAAGITVPLSHNEKGQRSISWSTDYQNVGGAVNVYGLDSCEFAPQPLLLRLLRSFQSRCFALILIYQGIANILQTRVAYPVPTLTPGSILFEITTNGSRIIHTHNQITFPSLKEATSLPGAVASMMIVNRSLIPHSQMCITRTILARGRHL
jgi:hypothetical protein